MKRVFHILSYFQYPLLLFGLYFFIRPIIHGYDYISSNLEYIFSLYNNGLIFFGVALSFSTLQDSTKTSLRFEKRVWQSPKKGKLFIVLTMILILIFFIYGFIGYFGIHEKIKVIKEFSYGSIVLAIGLVGYLKLQIEMYDNHRKDKKE